MTETWLRHSDGVDVFFRWERSADGFELISILGPNGHNVARVVSLTEPPFVALCSIFRSRLSIGPPRSTGRRIVGPNQEREPCTAIGKLASEWTVDPRRPRVSWHWLPLTERIPGSFPGNSYSPACNPDRGQSVSGVGEIPHTVRRIPDSGHDPLPFNV